MPSKNFFIKMTASVPGNFPIIVTGCQRSGTTFFSNALADALGLPLMDEFDFLPENNGLEKLKMLIAMGEGGIVIQAPFALKVYGEILKDVPDAHFVYLSRNDNDVLNSLKRILWCRSDFDKDQEEEWEVFLWSHIQYMKTLWEKLKTILPKNQWDEISYEALSDHPYFVPKELRKDFTVKQWLPGFPCGMKTWDDNEKCIEVKIEELSRL